MMYYCFILIMLISAQCDGLLSRKSSTSAASTLRTKEKEILDNIIGPDYDRRIRPIGLNDTGSNVVYVSLFIRNIDSISDMKMEYTAQVILRERWNDKRLAYDSMGGQIQHLTLSEPAAIWMPDLFITNEKQGHFHNIIVPNQYLRIFPDGDVLYSTRVSLTLYCPMNLKLFPHDRQECPLMMEPYGWTSDELVLLWKTKEPVQVSNNINLPKFSLEKFSTDYCTSKTAAGTYSCLRLDFYFKREFVHYLIQIYIPSFMLVIASWISFWLDPKASTARIALGITCLLTSAMQVAILNQSLPPVSYSRAIDVWTGICLTFVFGALLEFGLVNYFSSVDKETRKKNQQETEPRSAEQVENGTSSVPMKSLDAAKSEESSEGLSAEPQKNALKKWLARFSTKAQLIDGISRILFPVAFAIFNLSYWCTYL